jgi:hypothetical protein
MPFSSVPDDAHFLRWTQLGVKNSILEEASMVLEFTPGAFGISANIRIIKAFGHLWSAGEMRTRRKFEQGLGGLDQVAVRQRRTGRSILKPN